MMPRVKQLSRFWRRLDHRMLLRMIVSSPMIIPIGAITLLVVKGAEIGELVKRYGPFGLYRYSYMLRPDWTKDQGKYAVVIGEPRVPIRTTFKDAGAIYEDPLYVYVMTIPANESDPAGVYRHLLRSQRTKEAMANLMNEYQSNQDVFERHPEAMGKLREAEERSIERQRAISDALREFEEQYADRIRVEAAIGDKSNQPELTVEQYESRILSIVVAVILLGVPIGIVFLGLQRLWRRFGDTSVP